MTIQKIEGIWSTFFYEHKKGENVKFPGCASEMIGLPQEIFTPLFAMARIVGWCAHRNEELTFDGKRIIRPAYKNVLDDLAYIPIKKRW